MTRIKQVHPISKGKLSVLALASAAALTTMFSAAHAQTTTISSSQTNYLWLSGASIFIDSSAVLSGTNAIRANGSGAGVGTLTNQGYLNGAGMTGGFGVSLFVDGDAIINQSGGTINGTSDGILRSFGGYLGSLINEAGGTITGGNIGVLNVRSTTNTSLFGTIGLLSNAGYIYGGFAGIQNQGLINTLTNTALISSGNNGVYNTGTIEVFDNNSGGTISGASTGLYNTGTISTLTNTGIITAAAKIGIYNSGLISQLTNTSDGVISGANAGLMNSGTISTLTNNGVISSNATALWLSSGSVLDNFTNAGKIAGSISNDSGTALTIGGGTGSIFGTLTGSSGGLSAGDVGNIVSTSGLIFASGNQLLNDNIDVGSSTVTNSGVLQLNNPVTISGNYAQDANATLLIGVTSAATFNTGLTDTGYGRLVVNGDAVIAAGSAITLKTLGYSFAQGQRYVVVAANGSGTNYNASSLVYSASGYAVTASVQADSGNSSYSDLVLTLGSGSDSGSGDSSSTKPNNNATTSNASSALAGLFKYSGTDAALLAVFNPAAALGSTAAANKAGAQLSPAAVTGAATQSIDAASKAVSNVVTSHQDGYRLAQNGSSGVATGESHNDIALWGQVFGGRATQGERDSVAGYHANYRGLLIGADGSVTDRIRAGGLVSVAKTSVASDGDNTGSSADVNSYGITAYATYTGEPWYINVQAGTARQQYSTVRNISYTGFSGTADGSFHGSQYLSSVQFGYPLNLDAWLPGATLTPIAGLSYSTLRQNGYTETGGSGAALSVNAANSNSLKSELGAKLENSYAVSYGTLLPSVQLGWRHEYKDDASQTGASFVADSTGSTAFVTKSATPVANVGVLTLGLTLLKNSNLSLTGKYTLESGGGYTGQTGSVQVRWQY